MNMEKKISNITLPFIVLLLVVVFLGMIGIGEDDVSMNYSDADSITLRNTDNYNIGPSGVGVFSQNQPFINTGGITPPALNNNTANPVNKVTVPGEGVWMGMEIEGLSPGTITELGLPKNQKGVILDSVPPGSDAEKAGLKNGDIVRAINGQIIVNMADYIRATKNQKLTSGVIELERNGKFFTVAIPAKPAASQQPTFQQQPTYSQQPFSSQGMPFSQQPGVQAGLPAPNVDALTSASPKFTRIINKKGIPPITLNSPLPHDYMGVCSRCHEIVQGRIPLNLLDSPMKFSNRSRISRQLFSSQSRPAECRS